MRSTDNDKDVPRVWSEMSGKKEKEEEKMNKHVSNGKESTF